MWQVRRKWLPHRDGIGVRARFRRVIKKRPGQDRPAEPTGKPSEPSKSRWYDSLDVGGGCIDGLDDLAILAVVVVAALVLVFIFPPLVLIGIDLAWVMLVGVATAIGRVALGRPWSVMAVADSGERREWKVKGFRGAGQLRDTLQAEFDAGLDPRPDILA